VGVGVGVGVDVGVDVGVAVSHGDYYCGYAQRCAARQHFCGTIRI